MNTNNLMHGERAACVHIAQEQPAAIQGEAAAEEQQLFVEWLLLITSYYVYVL